MGPFSGLACGAGGQYIFGGGLRRRLEPGRYSLDTDSQGSGISTAERQTRSRHFPENSKRLRLEPADCRNHRGCNCHSNSCIRRRRRWRRGRCFSSLTSIALVRIGAALRQWDFGGFEPAEASFSWDAFGSVCTPEFVSVRDMGFADKLLHICRCKRLIKANPLVSKMPIKIIRNECALGTKFNSR